MAFFSHRFRPAAFWRRGGKPRLGALALAVLFLAMLVLFPGYLPGAGAGNSPAFVLVSAGPDGQIGTADDIYVTNGSTVVKGRLPDSMVGAINNMGVPSCGPGNTRPQVPQPASITLTADPQSATIGTGVSITAVVRDSAGQPVSGAAVHFETSLGTIDPQDAVTGQDGAAGATLVSSQAGTARVTASTGSLSAECEVPFSANYAMKAGKIAGGEDHTLAVKSDGTVWAWGNNYCGALGTGTATGSYTPVQVNGLSGVVAVAAGGNHHSLALKSDGTVWAWGRNDHGQLGDGTTANRSTPVQVKNLTGVVAIAAGGYYSLALKSDGTVWGWGDNCSGQLGDGTTTTRYTPVQVVGLTGVVAVATEGTHSLALKSDGTVWAWGDNYYGQLGDSTTMDRTTPVQVKNLSDVVAIAAGYYHSLALKSDGTVWAWGDDWDGQLGDGPSAYAARSTPVQVKNLTGVVAIAAGGWHSLALKSDGTVWAWGWNYWNQLGDGTTTNRTTPVQVKNLTGVVAIARGARYSFALKSDGTVWAWGANWYGQLGNGTPTDRVIYTIVQVKNLTGM